MVHMQRLAEVHRNSLDHICTIVLISLFGITGGKLHLCEYIYVGINTVSINQSIERV